jgi:HSP20 family protein
MFGLTPFDSRRNDMMNFGWNPFHEMESMERSLFGNNSLFDGFKSMRTDIQDNGSEYVLQADMPGFDKSEIKLSLKNDILTISADKKDEVVDNDENGNFIRRERSYGSYKRSFDVSGIDQKAIKANYKDGVLTLNLPKLETQVDDSVNINID